MGKYVAFDLAVDQRYQWMLDALLSLNKPNWRDKRALRQLDQNLVGLMLYGRELAKHHPQAVALRDVWSLTLIHLCRNKTLPGLDINRTFAMQVLDVSYAICYRDENAPSSKQFFIKAIRNHWIKVVDAATWRFTMEGYQFIYPFTRSKRSVEELRNLEPFVDHDDSGAESDTEEPEEEGAQ
jgi:hypothetical protein